MLDIDKIRQLVEMMVSNDLVEISLRDGAEEINLRRPHGSSSLMVPSPMVYSGSSESAPAVTDQQSSTQGRASKTEEDDSLVTIASPMVGTYYQASDPEAPPFVQIGSQIQPGTVLCILEAMKVFNEIKSEVAGMIERILVQNAQPVEYGQPLFLVKPV